MDKQKLLDEIQRKIDNDRLILSEIMNNDRDAFYYAGKIASLESLKEWIKKEG